jgi:hypothetical protein
MADAICAKLLDDGVAPKEARSRSFAIATKQLQRYGYLKPGTATPTHRGAGKISGIVRRNPDAASKLLTIVSALQKNWKDGISRTSLIGQLIRAIKDARAEVKELRGEDRKILK